MTIALRVGHFESRLRFRFSHAAATRTLTENVIAQITDGEGRFGYGEGCPRGYVTGETAIGSAAFIRRLGPEFLGDCATVEEALAWISAHETLIDNNPAAFSALEMAFLDLRAKQSDVTVETLLGAPPLRTPVTYSAVIGDSSPLKTWAAATAYSLCGFKDFKIKLSADPKRDAAKLAQLPTTAPVRVDANNLWRQAADCIGHVKALRRPVWAIEEPVAPGDIASLRAIAEDLAVRIVLDESLRNSSDLEPFLDTPETWIANIRVSKCGGVLRSVALARRAQNAGMGVILGAHVGETSLLTRGALAVGQTLSPPPLAREGGFGNLLLAYDISTPSLRFSRAGRFDAARYALADAPGWGLTFDPKFIVWSEGGG